jgi:GT2 family glycosyltransferase
MNKVLSIVIPVFNKINFTNSCLKDLIQLPDDHEIIVIDNGSTDETKEELSKITDPKVTVITNKENVFHSKACNQGYVAATADVVLFMNNDIRVKSNHSNWTKNIIEACKDYILVGPTMGLLDKQLNFVKEASEQLEGYSYIGGWCIAANKETWKKASIKIDQIWNEHYPMYFNDADLSFRARRGGLTLKVISLPDVVHFGKVSAIQLNINKLYNEGRKVFLQDWGK